jgi:3-hydroxyisobutyrate dehydrogenase-like beta-hydroxyacid dehydrogenase
MTPISTIVLVGLGEMGAAMLIAAGGFALATYDMRPQVFARRFDAGIMLDQPAKQMSIVANFGYLIGALTPARRLHL